MHLDKFDNLKLSSQFYFCPYALSIDIYRGCPHGCVYCFAQSQFFTNTSLKTRAFGVVNGVADLDKFERYLQGKYKDSKNPSTKMLQTLITARQPLHAGGMYDVFPLGTEKELQHGKKFLELLNRYDYPSIISTKNPMKEYAEVFAKGKHILQVSLISLDEDFVAKIERNAPSARSRLEGIQALKGSVQKVIVRLQPYIPALFTPEKLRSYMETIKRYGADAVTVEFLKMPKMKSNRTVCQFQVLGNIVKEDLLKDLCAAKASYKDDNEYSTAYKLREMKLIKKEAHSAGLEFYSAENDLRSMSDGPACCGLCGKENPVFESKLHNLNDLLFKAKKEGRIKFSDIKFTEYSKIKGIQHMWNTQSRKTALERTQYSVQTFMERAWKTRGPHNPAIFFKGLVPVRTQKGEIEYEFKEYE